MLARYNGIRSSCGADIHLRPSDADGRRDRDRSAADEVRRPFGATVRAEGGQCTIPPSTHAHAGGASSATARTLSALHFAALAQLSRATGPRSSRRGTGRAMSSLRSTRGHGANDGTPGTAEGVARLSRDHAALSGPGWVEHDAAGFSTHGAAARERFRKRGAADAIGSRTSAKPSCSGPSERRAGCRPRCMAGSPHGRSLAGCATRGADHARDGPCSILRLATNSNGCGCATLRVERHTSRRAPAGTIAAASLVPARVPCTRRSDQRSRTMFTTSTGAGARCVRVCSCSRHHPRVRGHRGLGGPQRSSRERDSIAAPAPAGAMSDRDAASGEGETRTARAPSTFTRTWTSAAGGGL